MESAVVAWGQIVPALSQVVKMKSKIIIFLSPQIGMCGLSTAEKQAQQLVRRSPPGIMLS